MIPRRQKTIRRTRIDEDHSPDEIRPLERQGLHDAAPQRMAHHDRLLQPLSIHKAGDRSRIALDADISFEGRGLTEVRHIERDHPAARHIHHRTEPGRGTDIPVDIDHGHSCPRRHEKHQNPIHLSETAFHISSSTVAGCSITNAWPPAPEMFRAMISEKSPFAAKAPPKAPGRT